MNWIRLNFNSSGIAMKMSPRDRRLAADARAIATLVNDSSIFQADGKGNPPTQYRLRFAGQGLALDREGNVVIQREHEIVVELGAAYPRLMPTLQWRTPIFHPNISTNGIVCLGGYGTHWVPSLTLDELCNMLWDMIRMKNFDINSPYNRDAASWVRDQKAFKFFPLDPRPLRDKVSVEHARFQTETVIPASDAGVEIVSAEVEVIGQGTEVAPTKPAAPEIIFID